MAKKTSGLGSGLDALFQSDVTSILEEIQNGSKTEGVGTKTVLKVKDIHPNPYQPRKTFDKEKLEELAQSIKEHGVFTPILVRKGLHGYELIAGERRLRASQLAGNKEIPAIIVDFNENQMMEISLLENIQRENLNVIEEANAYNKLIETLNLTQEQLANKLGKSREHVSNTMRLLKLPTDVQKLVEEGKLSMGHVRPLVTLPASQCSELATRIVNEGLSVRAVEAIISGKKPAKKQPKSKDIFVSDIEKKLQEKYATKVSVSDKAITINYSNVDELNRILEIMEVID